jgi:Flp pilus assembly protein TadG
MMKWKSISGKGRRQSRGQSTVEFVMYLPLILAMVLTIIAAGIGIQTQLRAQDIDYSYCIFGARTNMYRVAIGSDSSGAKTAHTQSLHLGNSVLSVTDDYGNPKSFDGAYFVNCSTYIIGASIPANFENLSQYVYSRMSIIVPAFENGTIYGK